MKNESNAIFEAYTSGLKVLAEKKKPASGNIIEEKKHVKKEEMKKKDDKAAKKAMVKEKLAQLKHLVEQAAKSLS